MRRVGWWLPAFLIALAAITLLAFLPARTYIAQRHHLSAAEDRSRILAEQNKELADRVARLHTDAEIERLAREQYDLVKPGEEAYAILPAPEAAKHGPKPAAKPVPKRSQGFWTKVGDTLSFWN
jgi:cell division protein FtsB